MSETTVAEPIFATSTGQLECGCEFDQHGVVEEGDWRDCPDHAGPVRVARAHRRLPVADGPDTELVRVRLFHNPDPRAVWFGCCVPGVPVFPVFEYLGTGSDHLWLCEQAWQVGNHNPAEPSAGSEEHAGELDAVAAAELDELTARLVDPHTRALAARYTQRAVRSLQPGDVVAVDDSYYVCAGLGWEPIDEPFIAHGPIPVSEPMSLAHARAAQPMPVLLDDAA